jgi:plasmid maintenance system antidote protein VapI
MREIGKINRNLKSEIVRTYGAQCNFAGAMGLRETVVSGVIRGRLNLSDDEKHRWAKSLDAPVDKIFPQEDTNGR